MRRVRLILVVQKVKVGSLMVGGLVNKIIQLGVRFKGDTVVVGRGLGLVIVGVVGVVGVFVRTGVTLRGIVIHNRII